MTEQPYYGNLSAEQLRYALMQRDVQLSRALHIIKSTRLALEIVLNNLPRGENDSGETAKTIAG